MIDPKFVFQTLAESKPVRLKDLPHSSGIYALHDHTGKLQYIGITESSSSGLFDRIYKRHVTGSEGRSHKFSQAYNVGRMWRERKGSEPDGRVAKKLRAIFIRRHCKATYLTLPEFSPEQLSILEREVLIVAGPDTLQWQQDRNFKPLAEPKHLVDLLIGELLSADERAAVERQSLRHARYFV